MAQVQLQPHQLMLVKFFEEYTLNDKRKANPAVEDIMQARITLMSDHFDLIDSNKSEKDPLNATDRSQKYMDDSDKYINLLRKFKETDAIDKRAF